MAPGYFPGERWLMDWLTRRAVDRLWVRVRSYRKVTEYQGLPDGSGQAHWYCSPGGPCLVRTNEWHDNRPIDTGSV